MGNISWLIVPFIVQLFAPNNQPNEWSNVFIFHAVLMIAMNLIFCLFASGKPEKWALVDVTNINSLAPSDRKKHSKTKIYAIDKNVQIRRMENEKELDKV
jgi:sugar phosphate permease